MKNTNCNKQYGSYIFVNTNFKRKNEPIFALASLESTRRISITNVDEITSKNKDEMFQILGNIIKNHYKQNSGVLSVWGNIVNYQAHLKDELYLFDTSGNHLDNMVPIIENCASMSLR